MVQAFKAAFLFLTASIFNVSVLFCHFFFVTFLSCPKHYRINHSELFADKHNHINGIENFWNQAKRHLRKFNGIPREYFHLFLKECEWRFNNSDPKTQLKQLNQWVRKNIN